MLEGGLTLATDGLLEDVGVVDEMQGGEVAVGLTVGGGVIGEADPAFQGIEAASLDLLHGDIAAVMDDAGCAVDRVYRDVDAAVSYGVSPSIQSIQYGQKEAEAAGNIVGRFVVAENGAVEGLVDGEIAAALGLVSEIALSEDLTLTPRTQRRACLADNINHHHNNVLSEPQRVAVLS